MIHDIETVTNYLVIMHANKNRSCFFIWCHEINPKKVSVGPILFFCGGLYTASSTVQGPLIILRSYRFTRKQNRKTKFKNKLYFNINIHGGLYYFIFFSVLFPFNTLSTLWICNEQNIRFSNGIRYEFFINRQYRVWQMGLLYLSQNIICYNNLLTIFLCIYMLRCELSFNKILSGYI